MDAAGRLTRYGLALPLIEREERGLGTVNFF